MVRCRPDQLAALDKWIARHPDPKPSRPEAIRRIIIEHLTESGFCRAGSPKAGATTTRAALHGPREVQAGARYRVRITSRGSGRYRAQHCADTSNSWPSSTTLLSMHKRDGQRRLTRCERPKRYSLRRFDLSNQLRGICARTRPPSRSISKQSPYRRREQWAWNWARANALIWTPAMERCASEAMAHIWATQGPRKPASGKVGAAAVGQRASTTRVLGHPKGRRNPTAKRPVLRVAIVSMPYSRFAQTLKSPTAPLSGSPKHSMLARAIRMPSALSAVTMVMCGR